MDENTNTTAPTEEIGTAIPIPTTDRKKKNVKRSIDELHSVTNPAKMSDTEKNDYIKFLRDENCKLIQQNAALEGNAKSAYEQYRVLAQKYDDFKIRARAKLNFTKQAIDTCRTSIILTGDLED